MGKSRDKKRHILQKKHKRTSINVLHLLISSKSFLDEEKCGSSQNGSRREMGTIEDIVRATKKQMSDKPILKYHRAAFLAFLRGVGGSQKIFLLQQLLLRRGRRA